MLINSPNISGSLTVTGNSVISGSLTVLGSITGAITGSATSASYVEYTNVANKPTLVSGSSQVSFNGITDKPTLVSGSEQISFNGITDKPTLVSGSSQITYSGLTGIPEGIVSGSAQVTALGFASTGSSNTFQASQTITGSLFITQNLVVAGSSSIQYISSSVLDIADNIITVNAFNPGVRFGGLAVIDSGSSPQVSGSLLFDSIKDQWIFVHQNQSVVTSSVVLMGPETYNDLGNESYISANRLPKGSGVEHLRDSNITDTGTVVSVNSNTQVTGSLAVTSTGTFSSSVTATANSSGRSGFFGGTSFGLRIDNSGSFNNGGSIIHGVDNTFVASYQKLSLNGSSLEFMTDYGTKLTIANNGTSTFSSNVIATGGTEIPNGQFYRARRSSSNLLIDLLGIESGTDNTRLLITGDFNIKNGSLDTLLNITTTGAATFNTTSAVNAIFNSTNAGGGYLAFRRSGTNIGYLGNSAQLGIGVNNALELRADNNFYLTTTSGILTMLSNGRVGIGLTNPEAILDVSHTAGTTNIIRVSNGSGNYRWRVDQNFSMIMTNASNVDTFSVTTAGAITATSLTTGTNSGSSVNITTNNNNGTSGSPLQTNVNFYGYNGNLNGQIRVDDIAGTAQVGTMKFYTWNSGQVLALTLAQTGAATFTGNLAINNTLSSPGNLIETAGLNVYLRPASGYRVFIDTGDGLSVSGTVSVSDILTAHSKFSGYNTDGLFSANARPSTITTPNGTDRIRFGYNDYGGGQYWGRIGFFGSTNWSIGHVGEAGNDLSIGTNYRGENLYLYANGNYSFTGSNVSDIRLKQNINNLEINALDSVLSLTPKSYYMKNNTELIRYGFIAQEVQEVLPDLINGTQNENNYLGLDYNGITAILVKAIQELKAENDTLKSRIDTLEQA